MAMLFLSMAQPQVLNGLFIGRTDVNMRRCFFFLVIISKENRLFVLEKESQFPSSQLRVIIICPLVTVLVTSYKGKESPCSRLPNNIKEL